ncbi:hypothetical protein [uncultured Hymenobacter sp.]|uniref:hypothetical protein n=1 Tax=uncultured Hymenobacter sp. TaxID=170016 RepID=UPI0035CAAF50
MTTPEVDLTPFQHVYQPGDRIFIELLGVTVTSAQGQPAPYPLEPGQFVGGNWVLH